MAHVIVVGGGVIGALSAYYLNRDGWTVTIIDRGKFGGACSHGNCGYVCPSHVLPLAAPGALSSTLKTLFQKNSPLKVRAGAVLQNLGWFLGFARKCNEASMLHAAVGIDALLKSSRTLYSQLIAYEQLNCEWDETGLLFAFHHHKSFEHHAEVDKLLTDRFGVIAKRIEGKELEHREPALKPGTVAGAYLYRNDAQLRPDRLMAELRRVLQSRGVQFVEKESVVDFKSTGQTLTSVRTDRGEYACDAAIVAAGAWTPQLKQLLGRRIPIVPGKGYSLTTDRPTLSPTVPMIFEDHRVAISPFRSGFRVGSTMEFGGYDESLNRNRLKLLTDAAEFYLKEALGGGVREEWTGFRPMVYDGLPLIGRVATAGNVIVAAGHGMLGLSMATGTGKLVAELLGNRTPHINAVPYSPARFN
jgi:D-amino-acid dehydrogenase